MTIFQIKKDLQEFLNSCIDPETGELRVDPETGEILFDSEAYEKLEMDKEEKIENTAMAYLNVIAECKAMKEAEDTIAKRRKTHERYAERLKKLVDFGAEGEAKKYATCQIKYGTSTETVVDKEFIKWAQEHDRDDLLTYPDPTPNKTAIKAAIKEGKEFEFARLKQNKNLNIK